MHECLSNLIIALEKGTNIHISVVFLNHYGNRMTRRPLQQSIHSTPVCDAAKSTVGGLSSCRRCRDIVLKKCARYRRGFGGICPKGVYEYCHPVIKNETVAAVIFVGNILLNYTQQIDRLEEHIPSAPIHTMENHFSVQDCIHTARLMESYILFLLDYYGDTSENPPDSLIENIKNYLEENLLLDISIKQLADFFGYNDKYLGRLFKAKTGHTISQYCNLRRLSIAKKLLTDHSLRIADIAGQCGYNNVTYFNRCFKNATGKTPQEFRNNSTA